MFKKSLFPFLVALLITNISSEFYLHAHYHVLSDPGDLIIIRPQEGEHTGTPRGPVFNPFTAQLWDSYIVLNSNESCGDVEVTPTSTTGDFFSTNFDTEEGSIIIPISGDTGYYVLNLVTEGGLIFDGEFDIF